MHIIVWNELNMQLLVYTVLCLSLEIWEPLEKSQSCQQTEQRAGCSPATQKHGTSKCSMSLKNVDERKNAMAVKRKGKNREKEKARETRGKLGMKREYLLSRTWNKVKRKHKRLKYMYSNSRKKTVCSNYDDIFDEMVFFLSPI